MSRLINLLSRLGARIGIVQLVAAMFLCAPIAGFAMATVRPAPPTHMCLQGSFIQLVNENGSWDKAAWRALFESFHKLQLQYLVVQWSVYDQTAFYASHRFDTAPAAPLETILASADRAGMQVMIGLSHDPNYWTRIEKKDKRAYLMDERLSRNMAAAAELLPLVSRHKSFAGWYISEEIDDINWQKPEDRDALFSYLKQLSIFLRTIHPNTKIGLSGFAGIRTAPSEVQQFWEQLLRRASAIDIVYFQDGIGVGKLNFNTLGRYYLAIKTAADTTGRELVPVIEAFEQMPNPQTSNGQFVAVPTSTDRLTHQVNIAQQYARRWIAFGIPEYLTPSGGEPAKKVHGEYLQRMQAAEVRCVQQ